MTFPAELGARSACSKPTVPIANGDYLEAAGAGGAGLGGLRARRLEPLSEVFLALVLLTSFTIPAGAVIGGIYGFYKGSQTGGSIYNNGFQPLDSPGVPLVFPY